jgi:hypothetical protein
MSAPLLLGQICPHWRAVALAAPFLWNHIHISLSFNNLMPQTSWVESWLERSKGSPLSIIIRWIWTDAIPHDVSHPVFDAIIQHSDRWEDVDLRLPKTAFDLLASSRVSPNTSTTSDWRGVRRTPFWFTRHKGSWNRTYFVIFSAKHVFAN